MGCRAIEGGGKSILMFLIHCISFQVMSVWAGGGGGVVFGILPVNKCVHFWRLAELIIERVTESKNCKPFLAFHLC